MLIEAKYYKKLKNESVQCLLCPHFCVIKNNEKGKCFSRINENGILKVLNYANIIAKSVDSVEKKPLFHFLPNTKTYSLAVAGCNMRCLFCQNWEISQIKQKKLLHVQLMPEEVVLEALNKKCKSISYTYTEPTIFFEYVLKTAKLAKKKKLKNVCVTNGYINEKPLRELYKYIDAVNVDLKSFNEDFYKNICGAKLKPVLDSLKIMKEMNVWIEISFLVIPNKNDDEIEFKKMCEWIKNNLGKSTPLHLLKFFPMYKMKSTKSTPETKMKKLYDVAKKSGLDYVYLGNMGQKSLTHCPNCKTLILERIDYIINVKNLHNNKCSKCNSLIRGVWS